MKKSKLIVSIFLVMILFILEGCIFSYSPVYIKDILAYENGDILTGGYIYNNGYKWLDYDISKETKEKIHLNVLYEDKIEKVEFIIYSPEYEINSLRVLVNEGDNSFTIHLDEYTLKDNDKYIFTYQFKETDNIYQMTVTGFTTSNGPKYMGSKDDSKNYVLHGVYISKK